MIALHARNPGPLTGAGNWTWLVPGRVPTLVDAGVGDPRHLDELEAALAGAGLAQVLVTHGHPDHASGAGAIARRFPAARFLKMPAPGDGRWEVGWMPLAAGGTVDAGDTSIAVIHTPGHAPDHLCFWHAETRTLFGGDLAIEGSSVWIPSSPGGDMAAYIESLERVLALDPARILPGHGPVVTAAGALLRRYIAHRRERELQIVDALRAGATTAAAVVARVYPGLERALASRAEETVTAHLEKLERGGAAARSGDAWHIIAGGPNGR